MSGDDGVQRLQTERFFRSASQFAVNDIWLYLLSGLGAVLYVLAGSGFAIDRVRCANWPSAGIGWLSAGLFVLALVAMGSAWLGLVFLARSVGPERGAWGKSLVAAVLVHAVILVAPPFLSDDPLAYGAIGSLVARHGQAMYAPLSALPADDAYRQLIGQYPVWLAHPSTYGPGINALSALVVAVAGDNVRLALRLFQLIAGLAILAAGLLTASAASAWAKNDPQNGDPGTVRLAAFRLVLFSPLALIEATGNAHNDALLALSIAGFAWAVTRYRLGIGSVALLLALLAKVSALLPIAFVVVRKVFYQSLRHPARRAAWLLALAGAIAFGLFWLFWPLLAETANTVVRLIAPPDGGSPFCTRSIECAPRWLFHFVFNSPTWAWLLGLAFRAGGVALLLVMAWKSRHRDDELAVLAAFLLFYYLFFHAYMQAWYLLLLLPLVIFLSAPLQAVAVVFMLSSLAQYGFDFLWSCSKEPPFAIMREIGGLAVVLLPPLLVLLMTWWKRPTLDS